jgi:hypothetical protein
MNSQNKLKYVRQKQVFVAWSSMPASERRPRTLDDLAEVLGIHVSTLSRWKYTSEFLSDLRAYAPYFKAAGITDSLAELAMKGNLEAIKTYYKSIGWKC